MATVRNPGIQGSIIDPHIDKFSGGVLGARAIVTLGMVNQVIGNSNFSTPITFGTKIRDPKKIGPTVPTSLITIPSWCTLVEVFYRQGSWGGAAGNRWAYVEEHTPGDVFVQSLLLDLRPAAGATHVSLSCEPIAVTPGNIIRAYGAQDSGTSQTLGYANLTTVFYDG